MNSERRKEQSSKAINKFIQDNATEDMSIDEINAMLAEHMKEINAGIMMPKTEETAETADDFMDLAEEKMDAGDEQGAIRLAKKALKLDPDNIDAEWFVVQHEEKDPETAVRKMQTVLEKGKSSLEKQGFFEEDCIGEFWHMIETRPYMRLKDLYVASLKEIGKLRLAAQEAEEMIRLNTNDNLGVRYTLMHLYAMLEDAESAERLLNKYNKHDEGQMLLALTLLYYKLGETDKAEKTLRRLSKANKETRTFVRDVLSDNMRDILSRINDRGGYSPFSEEELIMAYHENEDAYESAPLFFRWVSKTLKM